MLIHAVKRGHEDYWLPFKTDEGPDTVACVGSGPDGCGVDVAVGAGVEEGLGVEDGAGVDEGIAVEAGVVDGLIGLAEVQPATPES